MPPIARIVATLALLAVAAFCAFGFAATFEPSTQNFVLWRVGYGMALAALAAGLIWLWRRAT
jgi:hypothetical protein